MVLLVGATPIAAPSMTVAEFLAKAEVLKAKGMGALFAPELKPIVTELKSVGTAYRADLDLARAANRNDLGCPPPKGKTGIKPNEFVADLQAIPATQRAVTSMKTAFYAMMRRRFPCS